jgi:hypothetical protein
MQNWFQVLEKLGLGALPNTFWKSHFINDKTHLSQVQFREIYAY